MTRRFACDWLLHGTLLAAVAAALPAAAEVTAERCDHGVVIRHRRPAVCGVLDPFLGNHPIVWPIIGPTGKAMTRFWPMAEAPGEKQDHPHHRSLWFTHGNVNGVDFWAEVGRKEAEPSKIGTTVHRQFVKVASGKQAQVVTLNDWIGPGRQEIFGRRAVAHLRRRGHDPLDRFRHPAYGQQRSGTLSAIPRKGRSACGWRKR